MPFCSVIRRSSTQGELFPEPRAGFISKGTNWFCPEDSLGLKQYAYSKGEKKEKNPGVHCCSRLEITTTAKQHTSLWLEQGLCSLPKVLLHLKNIPDL